MQNLEDITYITITVNFYLIKIKILIVILKNMFYKII